MAPPKDGDGDTVGMRDSIEAKGPGEDVEMQDADSPTGEKDRAAGADAGADADAEGEADADADGEVDDAEPGFVGRPTNQKDLIQLISDTSDYLCKYEEDGHEVAEGFQRIPNKRVLPDYFEVIKEPLAFSTVRGKCTRKLYTTFTEFVHDVALICHNAQVYNRPSAPIFKDAVRLREVFKEALQGLVDKGTITAEEAELPDFGELPPVEDSPPPDPEEDEEGVDEDDEDDEEDDEDDDSDDEEGGRRRRRRGHTSLGKRDADDEEGHKRRGRPPKVFTPMEARINALLKGLRKFKSEDGTLRVFHFERLPDKATNKDYYQVIQNPIALDYIKKKAKRKKYRSVDEVMEDLQLMFKNAIEYNEEGSDVYEDAVELQKQALILADQEKSKSDEAFRDEDGRLPLSEIEHKGEIWRVGDWVHIRNPNDLSKPIVAQIYRTWQDESAQKWINACWYYRPEQTVHRFEKHFYENEVVKTGQYRDHNIEEVVDRCFVMFITRYPKGRPRGFPPNKEVYVCEARYNEEKYKFNKIKTWTSCLPDEVREQDYEMDLFNVPRKLKKVPSPIKHLLQADAKETDPLPKPTWGNPNAPPIVGAVHRRPREANESPPPEPSPEPQVHPIPQIHPDALRRPSMQDVNMTGSPAAFRPAAAVPVPSPSPAHYGQPHFAPPRPMSGTPPTPVQIQPGPVHAMQSPAPMPPTPHYPVQPYHQPQFVPGPPPPGAYHPMPAAPSPAYDQHRMVPAPPTMTPQRMPMMPTPNTAPMPHAGVHANVYNPPRPVEVYTLPEALNAAIPAEVRDQFHHDEQGRVLFFTEPPRITPDPPVAAESASLGHSARYLAGLQEGREEREKKRKALEEFRGDVQRKKAVLVEQVRRRREQDTLQSATEVVADMFLRIVRENEAMEAEVGDWRAAKAVWDEEKKAGEEGAVATD